MASTSKVNKKKRKKDKEVTVVPSQKSNIRNRKDKLKDLLTTFMEVLLIRTTNIPSIMLGM